MAKLPSDWLELYNILSKSITEQGKEATEGLLRQAEAKGFGVPTLKQLSGNIAERVAQRTAELGARLGLAKKQQEARERELEKSRQFQRKTQLLSQVFSERARRESEAFREKLLEKQFQLQRQQLEWQYELQKRLMQEAYKRQRKQSWLQLGLEAGLGAATAGLFPSLLGQSFAGTSITDILKRVFAGATLGTSGLASLLGQQLAPEDKLLETTAEKKRGERINLSTVGISV